MSECVLGSVCEFVYGTWVWVVLCECTDEIQALSCDTYRRAGMFVSCVKVKTNNLTFYSRSDPQFDSTPNEQKESQPATRLASPRVLTATRVKY